MKVKIINLGVRCIKFRYACVRQHAGALHRVLTVFSCMSVLILVALFTETTAVIAEAQTRAPSIADAVDIVSRADEFRGDPNRQFSFRVNVREMKSDETVRSSKLDVYVNNKDPYASISVFRDAGTQKGTKLLQNEGRWWLHKPGTRNAIRISPAQRLLGNASYADISSTNFREHYTPTAIEATTIGKTEAYKIELEKKNSGAAYQSIQYYISQAENKPIKADFYTSSGRLLKSMYFRKFSDQYERMLSTEWVIVDALDSEKITIIQVLNFMYQNLSIRTFDHDLFVDTVL